jgi:glycosyltransferase involved in cell wall biosynthesis
MLTHNRETLVARAIESIINQSFREFEFIIVDNGSSDRSGLIAEQYAARDARLRVLHRERGNIGSGRNAGLDVAEGDYIAFIDDDDYTEADFLEFLYSLAIGTHAEMAICGCAGKEVDEKRVMTAEDAIIEMLWRRRFNVQFPTKLIRRGLFDGVRFSPTAKYDDIELMPRILAGANCVVYHGLAKYTFERHAGNNSAWTTNHSLLTKEALSEYLRVYAQRTEWLCGVFPNSAAEWRYFNWSFMISMVEKIHRLQLYDCRPQCDSLMAELRSCREEFLNCRHTQDFEKKWMVQYV